MKATFQIGDMVYLKTDTDQEARMVTGILQRPNGLIYYLAICGNESIHYEIEITKEKNTLKAMGIEELPR
jgi:hypothetical protein